MKIVFLFCLFVFLALAAPAAENYFGSPVQDSSPAAASPAADPIVGKWFWRFDERVVFNADGTCRTENGRPGVWEFLHNAEVERKYRVVWEEGKIINKVIFSRDGQKAQVQNQRGDRFEARRAIVAPVKKTPADLNDPLLGRWNWYGGTSTTFKADGTCDNAGVQGVWTLLSKDGITRKYRFIWSDGKYVDEAAMSSDGNKISIRNNQGAQFDVRRSPPN